MKTRKCDLHIHSTFSDGKFTIAQIVDLYGQNNYSIISITDHLCENNHFFGQASHTLGLTLKSTNFHRYMDVLQQEAARALQQYNLLLLPGFEVTKNYMANRRSAHFLVIGLTDYLCPQAATEDILSAAKSRQALTIAAHPFHTGDFEFQSYYLWNRRTALDGLIDAWEFNYRIKTIPEVLNSGLNLVANSDFHHEKHFNSWRFSYEGELSLHALTQAIKEKKLHFFRENLYYGPNE